ncbi:SusC/RagA family TonB-linked outer membrane protein [Pedobacter sp. MC2016-14]|uniref:SusC/RagA family TonB-linked outer membrane protein n=1 Tax=Pedobacter sp. MC2016-14 TaxID=2897327 RepID=UPI001E52A64B|nr:SusC/RagA family TonB-linked outer membrane protein [Pedobacter sp. MC2016-14]MCD0487789.1 SusC/RagA family TonB-linked outer membrane protein [Pedobacter sp. MC2016-14]
MKLIIIILFTCFMQVSANSFAQRITLVEKHASLETLLNKISLQTGYDFFTNAKLIKAARRVDVNLNNATLEEALEMCFRGQDLEYTINNKSVIVKKKTASFLDKVLSTFANIDVRGRVVDENGRPLAGANILVLKGETTLTGASTNANGEFFIRGIDDQSRISISFIGYRTRILSPATDMGTISLVSGAEDLQTVTIVNTGYQTLSKERSAGSFGKPDMKVIANRTTSQNLLQRLEGQVPGLAINNTIVDGRPSTRVLIRGLTSVNSASSPLYVVDGIPIADFSTINPQDIADVSVLKDATAASIWGARAANGVIVVTTKKGERNSKVNVTYNGYVNFMGKPDLGYSPYLSSREYIQTAEELFNSPGYQTLYSYAQATNATAGGMAPHDVILYNQANLTAAQQRAALENLANTDNREHILDTWYRNAATINNTFSLQGGAERYAFYASGAYTKTISSIPGEKNSAYQLTLNQDFKVNNFIDLSLRSNVNYNVTSAKNPLSVNFSFLPYQYFRDASGNGLSLPWMASPSYPEARRLDFQNRSRINLDYNPIDEFERSNRTGNDLVTRNQFIARVKLFKGLRFEGTYGFTRGSNRSSIFEDQANYAVRAELLGATQDLASSGLPFRSYFPTSGGRLTSTNGYTQNWTIRNVLNYENSWKNGLHMLNLLAGQEAQEQKFKTYRTRVRGWNPQLLTTSSPIDWYTVSTSGVYSINGIGGYLFDDSYYEDPASLSRFTSYFGNFAYTFKRNYSLNGSIRNDQSNLFGLDKGAQNKPSWSIGARWAVSNEKFMDQADWLSTLALRLTYGIGGNSPGPGLAASDDILQSITTTFAPGQQSLQIATPANRRLTWERTSTANLGADFGILKNRITGSIDAYHRITTDMLGDVTTNILTGVNTLYGNSGKLDNKGIEISLNTLNLESGNFTWSSNLSFAYNKNKIVSLTPFQPITSAAGRIGQQFVEGYGAYALWAYDFIGLDNVGDPQIRKADGSTTKASSGNSIPLANDVLYMGTTQPKWTGGFGNTFTYKQFTLSAQTIFNFGHVMRNDVNTFYAGRLYGQGSGAFGNIHPDFLLRWRQPGDEARTNIPSYIVNSATSASQRNTDYYTQGNLNVLDASYIKLRDISLQYSLPNALVKRLSVQQITLRSNLNNILLWAANDEGIDPDYYGLSNSPLTRPIRPNQATISFGLDVRF